METTGLHMDCHIAAASQADIDRELDAIRTRAYAALGVKPVATASSSAPSRPRRRTVRGSSRPAARKPAARQSRSRARTGVNGQVTDEQLQTAAVGADAKTIAGAVGLSQNTVLRRLHKLEESGRVRREGERSQTRWFALEPVAA